MISFIDYLSFSINEYLVIVFLLTLSIFRLSGIVQQYAANKSELFIASLKQLPMFIVSITSMSLTNQALSNLPSLFFIPTLTGSVLGLLVWHVTYIISKELDVISYRKFEEKLAKQISFLQNDMLEISNSKSDKTLTQNSIGTLDTKISGLKQELEAFTHSMIAQNRAQTDEFKRFNDIINTLSENFLSLRYDISQTQHEFNVFRTTSVSTVDLKSLDEKINSLIVRMDSSNNSLSEIESQFLRIVVDLFCNGRNVYRSIMRDEFNFASKDIPNIVSKLVAANFLETREATNDEFSSSGPKPILYIPTPKGISYVSSS